MIVFDLKCSAGHVFEAWFGSSGDYEAQNARGLVNCPMCGDGDIGKAVMAPAVGAKGNQHISMPAAATGEARAVANMDSADAEKLGAFVAQLARAQAEALKNSAWVGDRFADRARAMHYGEEAVAPIHGVAHPKVARALAEEGVAVAPLPLPVVPPKARN